MRWGLWVFCHLTKTRPRYQFSSGANSKLTCSKNSSGAVLSAANSEWHVSVAVLEVSQLALPRHFLSAADLRWCQTFGNVVTMVSRFLTCLANKV